MKRYTMDWHYEREIEDPSGEWVRYEDVKLSPPRTTVRRCPMSRPPPDPRPKEAIMDDKKYWCCPDCGHKFWRSLTASTGTSHYCPKRPGVITVVNEPEHKDGDNEQPIQQGTKDLI